MIKDLRDARLVDAVPRVVAGQDWVRALSEAVGVLHERTLRYIDDTTIPLCRRVPCDMQKSS